MPMSPRLLRPRQAGGFDPRSIGTLVAWFDASVSSSLLDATSGGSTPADQGGVGRWEDLSGNGRHVTQTTANNRPLYKVAGQNGRSVVSFDGTNDTLVSSSVSLPTGATVFVVCSAPSWRLTSGSIYRTPFSHRNATHNTTGLQPFSLAPASLLDWVAGDAIAFGSGFESGQFPRAVGSSSAGSGFRLITTQLGSSLARISVNNARISTRVEQAENIASATATMNVGSATSFGAYWSGDIAEILYYTAVFSQSQLDAVTNYLNAKWAVY